jgi:hypothetical protein
VILFDNSSRRLPRIVRILLWIMGGLISAAGLFLLVIPTLDGPHSRLFANEASAVSKLRTVITLQDEYSAAHAHTGFACELPLLKPIGQQKFPDYSLEFLSTGVQSGYRFSLVSCSSDANRARVRYQVTAVPVEQGTTGIRTFCADEAGVIWYDLEGSATNCLASRHALQ